MATIQDYSHRTSLLLRPYHLLEDGSPTWLSTQLQVRQDRTILLQTTFSLTRDDLDALRSGLGDIVEAIHHTFRLVTSDEDFIFEVQRLDAPGRFGIGFWAGEPFQLMRGYRFVALAPDLLQFANDLLSDELNARQEAAS